MGEEIGLRVPRYTRKKEQGTIEISVSQRDTPETYDVICIPSVLTFGGTDWTGYIETRKQT